MTCKIRKLNIDVFFEHLDTGFLIGRLDENIRGPGFHDIGMLIVHGVRGMGYDRDGGICFPNDFSGLDAVDVGHTNVHDDQIDFRMFLEQLKCFLAIFSVDYGAGILNPYLE